MAYEFQAVDISVFDYHEMLTPLSAPGLTRPDFDFLVDEAAYNNAYRQKGQSLASAHFNVKPLRWWTLNFHHFWRHYQTIWYPAGQPDFWKLQMPFICKPTQTRIDVATGSPNFAGAARPTVFLSALGWSNSLDISLRGKMTADELRDFVGGLSSQKAPLFRASGQRADGQQLQSAPMTLPQVFQLLSEKVRADVYAPHLVDTLRVKRFLLITLSEFTGEDIGYYLSQRPGVKQMPVAARQVMHGILSGAPVAAAELTGIEKHQPGHRQFLLTRYNEADFAITYFDYGTLLFMQQTSVSGFQPSPKKTMKCHTSNLRNYLALTHALSWFYRATADTPDPKIAALRGHIKTDLEQLPTKFVNHFSINFHANYGPLKNL